MPIDIFVECLLTIAQATAFLGRLRGGRKPHYSTIWRWMEHGVRGRRLEYVQFGGQRMTSKEAIGRFLGQRGQGAEDAGDRPQAATAGELVVPDDVSERLTQEGF
jgi:hypothetical protein